MIPSHFDWNIQIPISWNFKEYKMQKMWQRSESSEGRGARKSRTRMFKATEVILKL